MIVLYNIYGITLKSYFILVSPRIFKVLFCCIRQGLGFCIFNYPMIYQICDVMMSINT